MLKHKPICFIVTLLVVVGGLNWGLVGLGDFIGRDLNLVHMLLGWLPTLESVVYLVVGVAALMMGVMSMKCSDCSCQKMDMKK